MVPPSPDRPPWVVIDDPEPGINLHRANPATEGWSEGCHPLGRVDGASFEQRATDLEREAFEAVDAVARRGGGRDPRERPGAGDLVLVDTSHGLRVWCPLAIPLEGNPVGWRSLPAAIRTPADRDAALWRSGPVVNGRGTLERWRELTAEGIVLHVEADPVCEWGDDGAIRWNEPPDIDPC